MVEVERLPVEVARGLPDLEELLDLGVVDVEVDRRRTAAERALADGQGQAVHHADEGDDAAGLAGALDLLANGPDATPIGADAAAIGGQGDVLVPHALNAVEGIIHRVQEAGNGQAPVCPAVRQHGCRRHEPQARDVVVDPLGMVCVIGIGRGDPGKHVLVGLAGKEVAVLQGGLAEVREEGVPGPVDLDLPDKLQLGTFRRLHRRLGVRLLQPPDGFTPTHDLHPNSSLAARCDPAPAASL